VTRIVILHLSDLHFSPDREADQSIVIEALAKDINRNRLERDLPPDLVLFSGDLVQAGEHSAVFDLALQKFIQPVLNAANVNMEQFHIVPGNHDISREKARTPLYVEKGLKDHFASTDVLNKFVDEVLSGKEDADIPLARLQNYEQFSKTHLTAVPSYQDRFVKTYHHDIKGTKIGLACLNTAWRSTGESDDRDRRAMLLGERNVDNAISRLNDCDIRLAMFHHPFDWLAEFDEAAVASRLMGEFDILLCGHIHRPEPQARLTPAGNAVLSQSGCIFQYSDRKYFNGYQYIIIDTDNTEVSFDIRTWYDAPRRSFDVAVNIADGGKASFPLTPRPGNGSRALIQQFLREVRPTIREAASSQINIVEGATSALKLGPMDAFICPPLTDRGDRPDVTDVEDGLTEEETGPDTKKGKEEEIAVDTILRSKENYIIVGQREAGKTSLAHFMSVAAAEGTVDRPRIPVVVDYRLLKSANEYNFSRQFASYFGVTKKGIDLGSCLAHGDFLIIVDNFSGIKKKEKKDLIKFVEKYNQNRWILLSDARTAGLDPNEDTSDFIPGFSAIHIQPLPRRSIRELTNRWCEQSGLDANKTFDAIMQQLKSSHLPRTGYIITLLLWAVYQEKRFEKVNEAVLLTNIADYLLGKADFTKALIKEFDATSSEITLQSLASFLRENGDFATKDETTKFLITFFERKALRNSAVSVLSNMVDCGILKESDGLIGFKYRCFQEYFYAGLLRNDSDKLREVISDFKHVEFFRELDLLSGLRRKNSDIMEQLSEDLRNHAPIEVATFTSEGFSKIATMEAELAPPRKQISDIRKKRLNSTQLDDLLDKTENGVAKRRDARKSKQVLGSVAEHSAPANVTPPEGAAQKMMAPGTYLRAIDLLGRIIRNSEFNDGDEKIAATRLFLDNAQKRHLLYSEMFSDVIDAAIDDENAPLKGISEEEKKTIKYIINQIWAVFSTENAFEIIGTPKLAGVYEDIFKKNDANTFEKITIAFMMMEGLLPNWNEYVDQVVEEHKDNRFVLDVFVAKIWRLIHTRYFPDGERSKIEKSLDLIERHLGTPKTAKGALLKAVRTETSKTKQRLDG
jgi:predicted MPP superfamily phosphohydrolase